MAKIHWYLISNSKSELNYFGKDYDDNEIFELINNAYELLELDFEEDENINENIDSNFEDSDLFFNYSNIRHVLKVEEIIDLHNQMLISEPIVIIENQKNEEENSKDDEDSEMEDYDPADLVESIVNFDD